MDRKPSQGEKGARNPGDGKDLADWTCESAATGARDDGVFIDVGSEGDGGVFTTFKACQEKGGERGDCWRVALFVSDPHSPLDFSGYHWVREDEEGKWSHKPSVTKEVTAKDYNGDEIVDPKMADCRWFYDVRYRFCRFACVCRKQLERQSWYAGLPFFDGPAYAIVDLMTQPARLVARGAELELPMGRLALVCDSPHSPALQVELLLTAGPGNPSMTLDPDTHRLLLRALAGLAPAEPPASYLGPGFLVSNPSRLAGFPPFVVVSGGLIQLGGEPHAWKLDSGRVADLLTRWFLDRAERAFRSDTRLAIDYALDKRGQGDE